MTLSVCCLTRDPASQVAAILSLFREVADEIVVAVDHRVPVAELAPYEGVVDRLIRYEYAPPMERQLAWLHAQCSGDWIFRIDGDEVPSRRLLDELPAQVAADDVVQYWHTRRWLHPEPDQWLASPPWYPDFQLRLVRNDPAMLWFPGVLHTSAAPVEPARFVEGPLYHLDTLTPYENRQAKVDSYGRDSADLIGPSGFGPNTMYLPEKFGKAPVLAQVPAEDRVLLDSVLGAPATTPPGEVGTLAALDTVTIAGRDEIDALWAGADDTPELLGDAFYQAEVEVLTAPGRMTRGSRQSAYVRVTNRGNRTWPGGVSNRPPVAVGWHGTGETYWTTDVDGYRVPFPAPVPPGGSAVVPIEITAPDRVGRHSIVIDVLHVFQRWFGAGVTLEIDVVAGEAILPSVPNVLKPVPDFVVPMVMLLVVPGAVEAFLPTLRSLRLTGRSVPLFLYAPASESWRDRAEVKAAGLEVLDVPSLAAALNRVSADFPQAHVLMVTEPSVLPPFVLGDAQVMAAEKRVASVSFFSNAAAFLSLPYRNTPVPHAMASIDEATVTKMLRSMSPAPEATPIPFATGPVVLLTRWALQGMMLPTDETEDPALLLADLTLQAGRRGMINLLDPGTFVFRAFDTDATPSTNVLDDEGRHWVEGRYPQAAGALHELMTSGETPHALAQTVARTKILGLRIMIDGSMLGPQEMGTQVNVMSQITALAAHEAVSTVTVALTGPVPRYAERALSGSSIVLRTIDLRDITPVGEVDVAHRPIQPTDGLNLDPWRDHAARISITVLDLIGYNNGAYHASPDEWLTYRRRFLESVKQADGVVVIAEDVADQLYQNRMPVPTERVYPVECGTDHLLEAPSTELRMPIQLLQRGFAAHRFVFALGTNYAHKNRDLAIAAFQELRRKDPDLHMVMVGAYVPYGSSRMAEARLLSEAVTPNLHILSDCTSEERNWLFKHAEAVLYATSAEGFGLVPYEAAQFGTPSAFVSFGPLREVAGPDLPVFASDWSPRSLADAIASLLHDPDLSAAQVAAVRAAAHGYTWARTADKMVAAYRHMLSLPRR